MTTEDIDDELLETPDRGLRRELMDAAIVGSSVLLMMVIYANAAIQWPGSSLEWSLVGWLIVVTAMLRVWGLPWRSR